MIVVDEVMTNLIKMMYKNASKSHAKNVEKYMKFKVKSRGNKTLPLRKKFNEFKKEDPLYVDLSKNQKLELSYSLLKTDYIDDSIIAIEILKSNQVQINKQVILTLVDLIEGQYINEWATVDTLSSKVFKPFSLKSKENTVFVSDLRFNSNIWLKRVACVTFINRVKFGNNSPPNFDTFIPLMFTICKDIVISTKERFSQLAVGWLLRELSVVDYHQYKRCMLENYNCFSREAIRYSIEKLSESNRKFILNYERKQKKLG